MAKKRITSPKVAEPPEGTWSNCLVSGNMAFIAGLVADNGEGVNAQDQAYNIFTKIQLLIEEAGGSMADIVDIIVYLTDIGDRDAIWQARREFFTGDFPASTLIEISRLVRPELKVEISARAVLGTDG